MSPKDDRDVLEVLKFELEFIEQGGYGRSVRTPWQAASLFQDSPSCLNFNDLSRPHPCEECLLINFVPEDLRRQNVPCHHIPLNKRRDTVASAQRWADEQEAAELVANWLRATIARIEAERAQPGVESRVSPEVPRQSVVRRGLRRLTSRMLRVG